MPYVSKRQYERLERQITPKAPVNKAEVVALEEEIFALNKRIRALPGSEPNPEWLALMEKHSRLVEAYHQAGGRKFPEHVRRR